MTITIVGLGPGSPDHLTLEAERILSQAPRIYLRTGRHPIAEYLQALGIPIITFDAIYETNETLAQVHQAIATQICDVAAREGAEDVVFALPGHPWVGEETTLLILEGARRENIPVRLVDGMSFVEPLLSALEVDLLDGVQFVDGSDLALRPYPSLDTDRGVIVGRVYTRQVASDVKLTLGDLYPDEHVVYVVRAAGTAQQQVRPIPLFELDRMPGIDHLTSVYVPPLSSSGSWFGLQRIVARLRGSGGCPWDQEQTHRSLRTHLLDEAYEVLDALDRDDSQDLCAELGDLALQIALHIQIAQEEGEFIATDVFAGIIAKLRRRHPHVFGDVKVNSASDVMVNWEQIKRQERGERDHSHQLAGVPTSLPALAQAWTYQERAARVGYDGGDGENVAQRMARWSDARAGADAERALGDLLFTLVAAARAKGVNPESALREANMRFAERFGEGQRGGSTS